MNRTNVRDALLGVVIALVAAYLFPVVLLAPFYGPGALTILFSPIPIQALFYVSWIVVPLGAALGMLIPRVAAGKRRWVAALYGAGYGAVGGLAATLCFAAVFSPRSGPDPLLAAVVTYCAVWVGAYACIRAKAPVIHR
jgi:hypothetical protein